MSREFAPWVEPVATVLLADAEEVRAFIRSAPASFWDDASAVDGWTNRDLLAHMGGGNDQMVQKVLRAVVEGRSIEAAALEPDTDAENAARVGERRSWPFDEVLSEYVRGVEELQILLGQLAEDDESLRLGGTPLTLGRLLRIVEHERHDRLHLGQLREGLAGNR